MAAAAVAFAVAVFVVVVAAADGAPTSELLWTRIAGTVRVSVDVVAFAYSATLDSGAAPASSCAGFTGGGVAFRCEGVHYTHLGESAQHGVALTLSGAPKQGSGVDSLGAYDSIGADFQGGSSAACALHTEIRYYVATASFVFVADFSEDGVPGANATALLSPEPGKYKPGEWPGLSTAFPSWSAGSMATECEHYSYHGNSLDNNWRAGLLSSYSGGLQAGPLLIYPAAST